MNTYLFASVQNLWLLAGWTMIHFLWLGTLVALAALVSRWMLRRASANVQYVVALTCLAMLAAIPIVIATWLHKYSPSLQVADQPLRSGAASRVIELKDIQPTLLTTPPAIATDDMPMAMRPAQQAAPPSETALAIPASTSAAPSMADPLSLAFSAINRSVQYLPWLWLIGTPLTFAFTATGLIGTRRLRRASRPITDGPIADTLAQLAVSLRLTRRVAVAVCDRIAAPVLIGIVRPIILLPPAALTGYSPDEIEMVLLHELAHVRRWDNLMNLGQRLVESLLFFHPAVWLISSWVRREREACCDALVVARTDHPHAYAELLVALAAQMPRSVLFHPAASSAMAAGPLRSRIRHILKLDDDPMLISGKSFALTLAALVVAIALAVLYLPSIGQAQQAETKAKQKSDVATPKKNVLEKEKTEGLESRNKLQKELQELQREIKRKYEDYLDIAKGIDQSAGGPKPETELLIRDIAGVQKKIETLTSGYYQLQTDYMVAKGELSDPKLLEVQAEEALKHDSQYTDLLKKATAQIAPSDGSEYEAVEKYRADFKKKTVREMRNKPNVPLQQLTQRFRTNAGAMQQQIASLTQNLEQKKKELEKRAGKSIDLAKYGEDLRNLQQAANDMSVKLENIEIDVEGPEPIRQGQSDDWPAGVVFPSPKEGEISARAWREWHIKVAPCTHAEQREAGGDSTLKVVGISAPPTKSPVILASINGIQTWSFDELATALSVLKGQKVVVATCYRNTSQGHVRTDIALDGTDTPAVEDSLLSSLGSTPVPTTKGSSNFPSLEDQKLTDLVWKRLKLEMEPIGPVDLKRIKAFGYEGGMRIASFAYAKDSVVQGHFTDDDILVGLHVWPTRNMKDITEILSRSDLADLSPLKFYVVTREGHSTIADSPQQVEGDVVHTGRISVSLGDNSKSSGITYQNAAPVASDPNQPNPQSVTSASDPKVEYLAALVEQASLFKKQALDKRQQAQGEQELEAANRQLERADRQLEDAKRQLEKARQAVEEDSRSASKKLEAAMKAKQDALIKRQEAKGKEAIEAAKQELAKANRRLEDVKRSLEKEIHAAETGNTNAQPEFDTKPRPPVAGKPSSGSASAVASPEELEIFRERVKIAEAQLKHESDLYKQGQKGGSKDKAEIAAYELALSQANLATAEGKPDEVLAKLVDAQTHAEAAFQAVATSYEAGRVSYDFLRSEANRLSEIKLKVARLKSQKSHFSSTESNSSNPYAVQPTPTVAIQSSAPTLNASFPATPSMTPEQPARVPAPKPARSSLQTQLEQMEKLVEVGAMSAADRDKWIQERKAAAEQMMEAASATANFAAKTKEEALNGRKDTKDGEAAKVVKQKLETASRQYENARSAFERAVQQLAELKQFVDSHRQDEQKSPSTQVERPIKVGNTNSWSVIVNDSADGKDSSRVQRSPSEPERKTAAVDRVVIPNVEQVKVAELHNPPVTAKVEEQGAGKAVAATPARDAKAPKPATDDFVIVAYEVPKELVNDVNRRFGRDRIGFHTSWDDRGRFMMQAPQATHDEFRLLLENTPKWRDPAAMTERAAGPITLEKKTNGQETLEWRTAGITFMSGPNSEHPLPNGPGGVYVSAVAPGSPANWNEVHPGDVLSEIAGFEAKTLPELESVLKTLQEGSRSKKTMRVNFYRNKRKGDEARSRYASYRDGWIQGDFELLPAAELNQRASFDGAKISVSNPASQSPSQTPKLWVYFFTSPDSRPSIEANAIVKRVVDKLAGVVLAEIDVSRDPEQAKKFGIVQVPSYLFVCNGEVVSRLVGRQDEKELSKAISNALSRLPNSPIKTPKGSEAVKASDTENSKSRLRYDGKTFDEWKNAWQTELNTEKRVDAVKALAAFGANGYGAEAAKAIIEIAGQYDWTSIGGNEAADALKKACLGAFGYPGTSTVARPIPENDVLLALLAAVDSKNTNDRLFATWVLPVLAPQNKLANDALQKLSSDADAKVRSYSFKPLDADTLSLRDNGIPPRIRQELMSNDSKTARAAIKTLVKDASWFNSRGISMEKGPALYYVPELFPLLFAPDESVRREARQALRFITRANAEQVVVQLLIILDDDARRVDHIEAMRAIAAMGPKASPALDKLKEKLSTSDAKIRIPAAAAIKMIVGKDKYQKPVADVIGKELGITVQQTSDGTWGALPRDDSANADAFNKFTEDVIKEQEMLFPPDDEKSSK
jgi:beta-lactamase regulating signal transducer with metallopeptidase domain